MFVLIRAITYATLFIALLLVFLPGQVLEWSGIAPPGDIGILEAIGIAVTALGGGLALWCVLAFAFIGKGTPAPFDPPRRLVISGPYRYVRNPMYIGAAIALAGAAIYYRSPALALYTGAFLVITHLFVIGYEEPTLTRLFGPEYQEYRRRVRRWIPGRPASR
ncbi:MAG: methyltransferase family protein [Gemmatimonadales bacterium]